MTEADDRVAEIGETLDTTDQLHNDLVRLKRLNIISDEEQQVNQQHVDTIVEALEEKLPDE
jgi:hypothetical protein